MVSQPQDRIVVADSFTVRTEWDVQEIEAEWRDFVVSRFPTHLFRDYPWSYVWWQAYARGDEVRIYLLREQDSGSIVGVLPFWITRGTFSGFPVRRLELLGRGLGCEDLLIDPDYLEYSKEALADLLLGMKWDIAKFSNFRGPASARILLSTAASCGFDMDVTESTWLDISTNGDFQTYFESRSRNFRKSCRVARRRTESIGELSFERYDLEAISPTRLAKARSVAEQGWQYQLGGSHFRRVGQKSFVEVLRGSNLDLPGTPELWLLKIGLADAALVLGVVNGNRWEGLEVAYLERFAQCSPGKILLLHIIEQMFEDPQIEQLILGAGGGYKDRLSTRVEPVDNFLLYRNSYYGKLISLFKRSRIHGTLKTLKKS